jgi:hypothetical protein
MNRWLVLAVVVLLGGCDTIRYHADLLQKKETITDKTESLQLDREPRLVTATGYAPISLQSGVTQEQKMLMAMRASKLRAYQELAAIVHGQYLFGTTQVSEMVIRNDRFNTAVGGIIRGARVVKTYPIQTDTYATILELDLRNVQRAYIDHQ